MANNFKSTQIKIVLGYILLCLLLGFSVNYIYQKMKDLTNNLFTHAFVVMKKPILVSMHEL